MIFFKVPALNFQAFFLHTNSPVKYTWRLPLPSGEGKNGKNYEQCNLMQFARQGVPSAVELV